ncbi:hypothetical protein M885DRAFT_571713 [Pelagophyceae sp. CCMP2097]|nr:hypothetical protein M885DRAFT_571713 [Pelagophyceae sp. CCMP2097]
MLHDRGASTGLASIQGEGAFYGYQGDDFVDSMAGATSLFYGGIGDYRESDYVGTMNGGGFFGSIGDDSVDVMNGGLLNCDQDDDAVDFMNGGFFRSGQGDGHAPHNVAE